MRAIIKFVIYLLYALILATCIYSAPKIKIESRNIAINHADSLFSIRIENISNYSCAFQFKLNDNFFSNINEIKQSIQELDYLNPVSEIESFIHSHLIHSHAEIKNAWRYEPLLLLNSSGKGEYGDFASLFYYLSHF